MSSSEFLFNIKNLNKKWFYDKDEVDELTKVEDEYDQLSYHPLSCKGLEVEFEKLRNKTSSDITSNCYSKVEIDNFISDLKDLILEYSDRGSVNVDDALSITSLNPVQNKIITNALSNKSDNTHTHDNSYYTKTEMNTKLSGKSDNDHTHNMATISNDGFMSSSDKIKLDSLKDRIDLPIASKTMLGGVIIGDFLEIQDGRLTVEVSSLLTSEDKIILGSGIYTALQEQTHSPDQIKWQEGSSLTSVVTQADFNTAIRESVDNLGEQIGNIETILTKILGV